MAVFEDVRSAPSHIIDGESVPGGGATFMSSINPYSGETLWSGCAATASDTEHAVQASRQALPGWRDTPYEQRKAIVQQFADLVKENREELTALLSNEAGKVLRDARQEVEAIVRHGQTCIDAYEAQCAEDSSTSNGRRSTTRYVPYGCLAVIGPFNAPMSRTNGHVMPALLAGNTVVIKSSEHTPLCGVALALLWQQAGLPAGVLNSLTGGQAAGEQLAAHPDMDGVLFVGGHEAGMAIFETVKHHPDKILALDMGGNNPLIVHDVATDALEAVSKIVVQSAFSGAGQNCLAAKRLIVRSIAGNLVERVVADCATIHISDPAQSEPESFYGPLITPMAARRAIERFSALIEAGGVCLLEPKIWGPDNTLMSPGIADVTDCADDMDEEILAPILKIYRYDNDLEDAIALADNTRFGLAAGIICSDPADHLTASQSIKSGLFAWNQPLTETGAFGPITGTKLSGNLRSAGNLTFDIYAYPVQSLEAEMSGLTVPKLPGMG